MFTIIKMILFMALVCSLIVITVACDICIEGYCHTKVTLMKNVKITDQLAIDWEDNILYVQLNSFLNTAFYIKNYTITKIHVVQTLRTSGMTVDPYTQELYTADFENNVYLIRQGSDSPKIALDGALGGRAAFLYFHNKLYFSKQGMKNVFYFDEKDRIRAARDLVNFTVTDFVKTDRGALFVADDLVYEYKWPFKKPPKVIASKKMALSVDKYENVYMGAAKPRVIYRKSVLTNKMEVYAAYAYGSVDKFVLDKYDNFIVYDAKSKVLSIWKRDKYECSALLPQNHVLINVHKPCPHNSASINENTEEKNDIEDDIVYDFFWKNPKGT